MIIPLFFIIGCQKEENLADDVLSQTPKENYKRRNIDLNEFQNKFFTPNLNRGLSDYLFNTANKGGDDYIKHLSTDRIIEFSNGDITTFTFNVITADADHESFTNLIYFEKADQVGEVILKYSPTTYWLDALKEGNKLPFSGTLSLMSSDGEIIQTDDIVDGIPQGRASPTPCFFSATPIWVDCYGAECPCKDGNGFLGGWAFEINCGPVSGGGGDPGSGDPGSGGSGPGSSGPGGGIGDSGNGQQQGSNGDLPTDPLEWSLFNELNTLRVHKDDYFYYHPPVNIDENLVFDNFEDFRSFISDYELDYDDITEAQDGTTLSHVTLTNSFGPDVEIIVKSTLRDNSLGQQYLLHNVDSFLIGNNYLGYFFDVKSFNLDNINGNDWAEIIVFAETGINAQIGPIPFYFSKTKKFLFKFDIHTGGFRGFTELF